MRWTPSSPARCCVSGSTRREALKTVQREITIREVTLHLTVPFATSRATRTEKRVVVAEWSEGGHVCYGEASVDPYFGETPESIRTEVEAALALLPDDPLGLTDLLAGLARRFPRGGAARCALDVLAHDRAAQQAGVPLHRWLGLDVNLVPPTSFTIGLARPAEMAEGAAAAAAAGFEILKVKLGGDDDVAIVRSIRERFDGTLRVDPNAAWDVEGALRTIDALAPYQIEFVEQPLPPEDLDGLRRLRSRSALPIVVDESVVDARDVERVSGIADGVNVKLQKCGGIAAALDVIAAARRCGLRVMVGCRAAETSVSISAAAHLAALADWADLDGNLLVADDPFVAVEVRRGRFVFPERAGLGVRAREAA